MKYTDNGISTEQWRDIAGYEGVYQVSDLGRVRSHKSGEWIVMKGGTNSWGYLNVGLCKDGKRKVFSVHRLVAQAFITNDNIFNNEINHINEVKTDNITLNQREVN